MIEPVPCEWIYRQKLALALKSAVPERIYGQGLNLEIEVAFGPVQPPQSAELILRQVFARIDHRNLAVDVDLGIGSSLAGLAQWLKAELKSSGLKHLTGLRVSAGDASVCSMGSLMSRPLPLP